MCYFHNRSLSWCHCTIVLLTRWFTVVVSVCYTISARLLHNLDTWMACRRSVISTIISLKFLSFQIRTQHPLNLNPYRTSLTPSFIKRPVPASVRPRLCRILMIEIALQNVVYIFLQVCALQPTILLYCVLVLPLYQHHQDPTQISCMISISGRKADGWWQRSFVRSSLLHLSAVTSRKAPLRELKTFPVGYSRGSQDN